MEHSEEDLIVIKKIYDLINDFWQEVVNHKNVAACEYAEHLRPADHKHFLYLKEIEDFLKQFSRRMGHENRKTD